MWGTPVHVAPPKPSEERVWTCEPVLVDARNVSRLKEKAHATHKTQHTQSWGLFSIYIQELQRRSRIDHNMKTDHKIKTTVAVLYHRTAWLSSVKRRASYGLHTMGGVQLLELRFVGKGGTTRAIRECSTRTHATPVRIAQEEYAPMS